MVSIIKHYSPKIRVQKPDATGARCCVVGCGNRYGLDTSNKVKRSYHVFPKNQKRKELWTQAIPYRGDWTPGKYDMVCDDHFVGGKPSRDPLMPAWIPSIFPAKPLPKQKPAAKQTPPPKPKLPPKSKPPPKPRQTSTAKRISEDISIDMPKKQRKRQKKPKLGQPAFDISDHDYVKQEPCQQ